MNIALNGMQIPTMLSGEAMVTVDAEAMEKRLKELLDRGARVQVGPREYWGVGACGTAPCYSLDIGQFLTVREAK